MTSVEETHYSRAESFPATRTLNNLIDEDLLCTLCKLTFDNPVILECGHSFCKACVERFWENQKESVCPECSNGLCFQTRRYFINRALNKLAEKSRHLSQTYSADGSDAYEGLSLLYCTQRDVDLQHRSSIQRILDLKHITLSSILTDDSGLGEDDDQASSSAGRNVGLSVLGKDSSSGIVYEIFKKIPNPFLKKKTAACDRHYMNMKLYCHSDSTVICIQCGDQDKHRGHTIEDLSQAAEKYMNKLKAYDLNLKSKLEDLIKLKIKEQEDSKKTREKVENLKKFVDSQFEMLHLFLLEKQQQLIHKLKKKELVILRVIKENLRIIENEKRFTEELRANIQTKMKQKDIVALMTDTYVGEGSLFECPAVECVKKLVTPPHLIVGVYEGPLQYRLWKEMKSVIYPGVSSVKLDPNTAHPALHLSKDLTCVRVSDVKQQLSDLPERFDECPCVLGSEGITEGKYYWEVDVVNRTNWVVGMAKESIQRKGKITMTPENGYWTLCLQNGDIYAQDSPMSIKLSGKPTRIGVYLDYKAGQVSFYNENISHLYTFNDTFRETVYPFMGLYDNYEKSEPENLTVFFIRSLLQ